MNRESQIPNNKKLAELMLYVAEKSERDPRFGATKLNKILFYSDFLMYWKTGLSITGQEYMKLEKGPAPRRLLPVQKKLLASCHAVLKETDYYGRTQKRLIALRKPDLSMFTGEEIAEVDRVIEALADLNGTLASELAHRLLQWQAAENGETIPYSSVYLSKRDLTEEELRHGLEVAARIAG
jgi:hypothetical protein